MIKIKRITLSNSFYFNYGKQLCKGKMYSLKLNVINQKIELCYLLLLYI